MLVPFAIDATALAMEGTSKSEQLATHKRLIERWLTHGLLIFSGKRLKESSLVRELPKLPQDVRKIWQEAFKVGRSLPGAESCPSLENVQSLSDLKPIAAKVRLACLEKDRYYLALDLDPDKADVTMVYTDPAIEVARFDFADRAKAFREAEDVGGQSIEGNCKVANLWNERFGTLASYSSNLIIVDQHALKDGNSINGLEHLLILLDGSARRCAVHLYCSYGYDASGNPERLEDLAEKLRAIRSKLSRGGVPRSEIHLHATHFGDFRIYAHDRYLRFDAHVFEIGVGVEVFFPSPDGCVCRRTTSAFKRRNPFHDKTESHLRSMEHRSCPWQV